VFTKNLFSVIKTFLIGSRSSKILLILRLSQKIDPKGYHRLKKILHNSIQNYGVYISSNAIIGAGIKLPHPVGIVVGDRVVIGKNVTIFQNVTIGGARIGDAGAKNYPTIGDNVVIFAGAVVVGKIVVGDGAVIGANSVVLSDVPSGETCVGVPGKLIKKDKAEACIEKYKS
jgi:serine O-acetyltransferase